MSMLLGRDTFGNEADAGNVLSPADAEKILSEWVPNVRLQLHMRQVAHLMKKWAAEREGLSDEDQYRWYLAGLLHDADWDQWPDQHCRKIVEELESRHIDPEIIRAIASHGPAHFGVTPVSQMDKMLYAFDELSGLIHAYALMRPTGYDGMELKGVKKRLKEKYFAAGVSREEIKEASELALIPLDDLINFIIEHQREL